MKKRYLIAGVLVIIAALGFFLFNTKEVSGTEAVYYKSISCGCCDVHSKYLESKGFETKVNSVQDASEMKTRYGIPNELQSCHTAIIEGYFVEGHMPVEAINKMLSEKPDIAGIALPGMPLGSPGMTGSKQGEFVIYAVNHDGSYYEFMRV